MKTFKVFLALGLLFGLNGCLSSSSNYYVLSMASNPQQTYSKQNIIIGVEKVTVPGYLYKREIAVATSSSQISLLGNALWGEDLDTGLTNRLIGFLQKKFNQPNVYAYPWGIDKQPHVKVSVHVTRFIALKDKVYLDVTWSLENLRTKRRKSHLFSTSVHTKRDAKNIVDAMDRAFTQFEERVAEGIR